MNRFIDFRECFLEIDKKLSCVYSDSFSDNYCKDPIRKIRMALININGNRLLDSSSSYLKTANLKDSLSQVSHSNQINNDAIVQVEGVNDNIDISSATNGS